MTYSSGVNLYLNGDELEVVHVTRAGNYPFIDLDAGGSIDGVVAAADQVLAMIDDRTKLIPGHGALATKADLRTYREMVGGIRDRVRTLIAQGKTLEQILAAKPSAQWDATWGKGFIGPDLFVSTVHRSLTESKPTGPK